MKIIGAKLVTGEIIIGKKVEEGIENPYVILLQPTMQQGQVNVGLAPFFPPVFKNNNSIVLDDKFILKELEVIDDIVNKYVELTSNIKIVKNASIINQKSQNDKGVF